VTDVAVSMQKLNEWARELDALSKMLTDNQRKLEPVMKEYEDAIADEEAAMWTRYEAGEGKWPGAEFRVKLARRKMAEDLRDRYDALMAASSRMETRIGILKRLVDAERSVLSAEKTIMEAER